MVKEPSSSLHLDTHKYKTQRFELTRRKGDECSRFFLLLLSSLSLSFSLPSLCPLPSRLFPLTSAQQIYFTFLPFLDLSQYLATLRHPAPARRAPVTRRYGFEPSVMDGSLSRLPRTAASTLSLIPFFGFLLYLEDARRRRNPGPLGFEKSKLREFFSQDCLTRNTRKARGAGLSSKVYVLFKRSLLFSKNHKSYDYQSCRRSRPAISRGLTFQVTECRDENGLANIAESIVQERRSIVQ